MDRILERHPLPALWGDMPSDELAAMRIRSGPRIHRPCDMDV